MNTRQSIRFFFIGVFLIIFYGCSDKTFITECEFIELIEENEIENIKLFIQNIEASNLTKYLSIIPNQCFTEEEFIGWINVTSSPTLQNKYLFSNSKIGDIQYGAEMLKLKNISDIFNVIQSGIEGDQGEDVELNFLKEVHFSRLSPIEKYHFIEVLRDLTIRTFTNYNIKLALSLNQYGLHLVSKMSKQIPTARLKLKLQQDRIRCISTESSLFQSTTLALLDSIKNTANEQNWHGEQLIYKALAADIDQQDIDYTNEVDSFSDCSLELNDLLYLYVNSGFQKMQTSDPKSLEFFAKAKSMLLSGQCGKAIKLIALYEAIYHLRKGTLDQLALSIEVLKDTSNCNQSVQRGMMMNALELESMIANQDSFEDKEAYYQYQLDNVIERREIAQEVYGGYKSYHLGDYYIMNLLEYLRFAEACPSCVENRREEIIALFDKAKTNNSTIQQSLGFDVKRGKELTNRDREMQELMIKINEFKNDDDYENPAYEKVFQYTIEEHLDQLQKERKDQEKKQAYLSVDLPQNIQLLEFATWKSDYGSYFLKDKELIVQVYEQVRIDSLCMQLRTNIQNQRLVGDIVDALRKILNIHQLFDLSEPLHIIPDGQLAQIPFNLIYPELVSIKYLKSARQMENQSITTINTHSVLSYSNTKTINSRKKRLLPELPFGLKEASDISNTLQVTAHTGANCSYDNFRESMASDLLHMVTHSSSDQDNRLNNFIILRKEDQLDTIYSMEISSYDVVPKVVFLSSCDTGSGDFVDGGGIHSFANAFLANGTQTVIKTVWPINDEMSFDFMQILYDHWERGNSLAESFQKAQKALQAQDPLFWAGFILEGNGEMYLKNRVAN